MMQSEARFGPLQSVAQRPLFELLRCPPHIGSLLSGAAQCLELESGEAVFRQAGECNGVYVVISGDFQRRTLRMDARLTLGPARPGDIVELGAALGDGRHTYTLTALTAGAVLMLPMEALRTAFEAHPQLRMQLLEELAREVSRGYGACCAVHRSKVRHRATSTGENEVRRGTQ